MPASNEDRQAYLAAAAQRQNMKTGIPLEALLQPADMGTEASGRLQAMPIDRPAVMNFADLNSQQVAAEADDMSLVDYSNYDSSYEDEVIDDISDDTSPAQRAEPDAVGWVSRQNTPDEASYAQQVAFASGARHALCLLRSMLVAIRESLLLLADPSSQQADSVHSISSADQDSMQRQSNGGYDALEAAQDLWERQQEELETLSSTDDSQREDAEGTASEGAASTQQDGLELQSDGWSWTAYLKQQLGVPAQLDADAELEQQGMAEKVSDPQPLGRKWIGLTASMFRPVSQQVEPAASAPAPQQQMKGAASPDQAAKDAAVLEDVAAEDVLSMPMGDAVRSAAAELAAITGISVDTALDKAVSLVLQERNALGSLGTPLLGFSPGAKSSSYLAREAEPQQEGIAPLEDGLAVPPEAGPEQAHNSGGILDMLAAAASEAAKTVSGMLPHGSFALKVPEALWNGKEPSDKGAIPLA